MPYRVWHAGSRVQKNSKTGPPALVRSTDAVVFLAKVAWLSSKAVQLAYISRASPHLVRFSSPLLSSRVLGF